MRGRRGRKIAKCKSRTKRKGRKGLGHRARQREMRGRQQIERVAMRLRGKEKVDHLAWNPSKHEGVSQDQTKEGLPTGSQGEKKDFGQSAQSKAGRSVGKREKERRRKKEAKNRHYNAGRSLGNISSSTSSLVSHEAGKRGPCSQKKKMGLAANAQEQDTALRA